MTIIARLLVTLTDTQASGSRRSHDRILAWTAFQHVYIFRASAALGMASNPDIKQTATTKELLPSYLASI